MSGLEIWLIIILAISCTAIAFLVWYLRKLLAKFLFISQNLGDLVEVVENYHNHLKQVNNMETYHGDETIEYLMKHTASLLDILEDYRDVYDITVPLEDLQEEQLDDNTTAQTQAEEETQNKVPVNEENVFYAGTRRRNS